MQLLVSCIEGAQVAPLLRVKAPDELKIRWQTPAAAWALAPTDLNYWHFNYEIAWAMTPYKLQSRNMKRLVMAITRRSTGEPIQINSFYVMASRVNGYDGLRFVHDDEMVRNTIANLKHTKLRSRLHAFEKASCGKFWNADLAKQAFNEIEALFASKSAKGSPSSEPVLQPVNPEARDAAKRKRRSSVANDSRTAKKPAKPDGPATAASARSTPEARASPPFSPHTPTDDLTGPSERDPGSDDAQTRQNIEAAIQASLEDSTPHITVRSEHSSFAGSTLQECLAWIDGSHSGSDQPPKRANNDSQLTSQADGDDHRHAKLAKTKATTYVPSLSLDGDTEAVRQLVLLSEPSNPAFSTEVLVRDETGLQFLTRDKMVCLAKEEGLLNEEVINFYLWLVRRQLPTPTVVIFSTLMFDRLTNATWRALGHQAPDYHFSDLFRWTIRCHSSAIVENPSGTTETGAIEKVVVPINIPGAVGHWVFIIVNNVARTIEYYDPSSLSEHFAEHIFAMQQCIDDQRKHQRALPRWNQLELFTASSDSYRLSRVRCPLQTNGHDCGLFMLKMIAHMLTNESGAWGFDQGDLPALRGELLVGLARMQPPWLRR